jgi:Pvc16 N-terminal domain
MSNALAIAGVTATLQYYLGNVYSGLSSTFGGAVTVSSKAPDLVQSSLGDGSASQNQVNIFLHQVTYNVGWRNAGLPSLAADGQTVLKNPPLALDLHYLLTAYGSADWQAEALLGYALLMLHQNPVLARSDISTALQALPTSNASNPLSSELGGSGLAQQFEMIKITPSTLGREELAWLWTALKADYRPSFPFQVSVVLLQPPTPLAFSLPVLSRAITVQAGAPAQLLLASPPTGQAAAAPGMTVTLSGSSLAGATGVVLANARLGINYLLPFTPPTTNDTNVTFVVPNEPATLPAGLYNVTLQFPGASVGLPKTSNALPLPIAPSILATPTPQVSSITGGTQVTINCAPSVLPNQAAQLIMGGTAVPALSFTSAASQLSFQFTPALATGSYLARLQVDGVMSPVTVDWNASPPTFTGPMVKV